MLSHNGGRRVPRGLIPALAGAAMFGAVPVLLAQPAQAATAGCYGDCQPGVVRSAGSSNMTAFWVTTTRSR